jgi:hypothetical protein
MSPDRASATTQADARARSEELFCLREGSLRIVGFAVAIAGVYGYSLAVVDKSFLGAAATIQFETEIVTREDSGQ